MSELILHIGAHRTGTTALQRVLARHRPVLAENGYCYPFENENHQRIAWDIYNGKISGQQLLDMLMPYDSGDRIMLSAEDFCRHTDLKWVYDVQRAYHVRAIFYIRRQDDWLMSWYNQHIKWPFSRRHSKMNPSEFLSIFNEFYWIDYYETVKRWSDVLGRENIDVRIVEKGQVEDVVKDFCEITKIYYHNVNIDYNCDTNHDDSQRANDSLPVSSLGAARHLGLIDLAARDRMRMINTLRFVYRRYQHTYRTLFNSMERKMILYTFRYPNALLAHDYLGRDALFKEGDINDEFFLDFNAHPEFSLENNIAKILQHYLYDKSA
jgi:hypothetical protein